MAAIQHTARVRASEPFWLINEPQLPMGLEQARQHTQRMRMAGTSLAMGVIRNLLRHSEPPYQAKKAPRPADTGLWAFSPTQLEGLRAALYFLRRHSDALLRAERNG